MYEGPIIDIDVHHAWRSAGEILERLPRSWRQLVASPGQAGLLPAIFNYYSPNGSVARLDAMPDGGPAGSDYALMRRQLLDPHNVTHCVLSYDVGFESGAVNPYLAQELCRAANDWSVEHWLSLPDERVLGAILVATELPDAAAAEIRRLASHPRLVEVLLVANAVGKPFGHPAYHPIYEAAAEVGLPVGIHLGGHLLAKGLRSAGGVPESRLEEFATNDQPGMHHATSLVTHAVFERFPTLRVVLKEHGFSWLPWVLWNLDAQYPMLRRENPRVKRRPSDVVREHVIVSTQPFDHTPKARQMIDVLTGLDGIDDILAFATDYPHWDADEPRQVATRLPEAWHDKVFFANAARVYQLATPNDATRRGALTRDYR